MKQYVDNPPKAVGLKAYAYWRYIESDKFAVCSCLRPITRNHPIFASWDSSRLGPQAPVVIGYKAYKQCENCLGYGSQPIPISEVL